LAAQTDPLAVKAYLSRHPKPKLVVLVVSPLGLAVDSAPWADVCRRVTTCYGLEIDGAVPLSDKVPYLVRSGLQTFLGHPDYRSVPLADYNEVETYVTQRENIHAARGFQGEFVRAFVWNPPSSLEVLIRDEWDRGAHEMADSCAAARVPLLIRFAPIEVGYMEDRDLDRLDRWAQDLEEAHTSLTVARPIQLAYEKRFMMDAIHLNVDGVDKFTPVLAKDVQQALESQGQNRRARVATAHRRPA